MVMATFHGSSFSSFNMTVISGQCNEVGNNPYELAKGMEEQCDSQVEAIPTPKQPISVVLALMAQLCR